MDPDHQGRGLGAELLSAVVKASGAARAWLATTDIDSPAARLYRANGWRSVGHGPDAPDGRPALVLGLIIAAPDGR